MLKVEELWKSYGKKTVLQGANLCLERGEIKGLIGVNGAGKTTLIECVCGVKKADSGKVTIDGQELVKGRVRMEIKKKIGYMPQSFGLFYDLTVQENLGYLGALYSLQKEQVDRVIELCALEEQRKVLARNLSGGYRQLLSMAGALIHEPKLLILDEPTSSMDPVFRRKFWEIIHRFRQQDTTILFITHYFEELVECDRFVSLSGGKISEEDSIAAFKKDGMLNVDAIMKKYTI